MNINYLDFEQPIAELLAHIEELKRISSTVGSDVDMSKELAQLEKKNLELTKKIYSSLSSWQISQLSPTESWSNVMIFCFVSMSFSRFPAWISKSYSRLTFCICQGLLKISHGRADRTYSLPCRSGTGYNVSSSRL